MSDDASGSDFSGVHPNSSDETATVGAHPTPAAPEAETPRASVQTGAPRLLSLSQESVERLVGYGGAHPNPPNWDGEAESRDAHPTSPDRDQELNRVQAEHQAGLSDWTFYGAFNLAQRFTQILQLCHWLRADGILPEEWKDVRLALPAHIRINFDSRPANEAGSYTVRRSVRDGTRFNINVNPNWIITHRRSLAQIAAAVCHSLLHLCQDLYEQQMGRRPRGDYHSKEFRRNAEQIGIPCDPHHSRHDIVAGSRFEQWLDQHRISKVFDPIPENRNTDDEVPAPSPEAIPRKKPKRSAWRCGCPLTAMVPSGKVMRAVCQDCSEFFRPAHRKNSPGEES
jgi:hypothetical protein